MIVYEYVLSRSSHSASGYSSAAECSGSICAVIRQPGAVVLMPDASASRPARASSGFRSAPMLQITFS